MNDPKKSDTSCADEDPSAKPPADIAAETVDPGSGEMSSDTDINKSILKEIKDILGDVRGLVQKQMSGLEKSATIPVASRVRLEFEEKEGKTTMSRCEIIPLTEKHFDWMFFWSFILIVVLLLAAFIGVCSRTPTVDICPEKVVLLILCDKCEQDASMHSHSIGEEHLSNGQERHKEASPSLSGKR